MNVNPLIMELNRITGLPVVPDLYAPAPGEKRADKWITFTYQDERPVYFGDNSPLADTAYISVNLFTPTNYNYLQTKEQIKEYLESIGIVTNCESYVYLENQIPVRQTVFEVTISEEREGKTWLTSD
jgi:hypothetical protein